jgi:hypothetical protein
VINLISSSSSGGGGGGSSCSSSSGSSSSYHSAAPTGITGQLRQLEPFSQHHISKPKTPLSFISLNALFKEHMLPLKEN